jgi:hypothetical protein
MSTNNKISSLISSQVPFFVRNDHPNFVLFLQKYFEYLEQDNKVVQVAKDNIPVIRDIDLTSYEENLYSEFIKLIPQDVIVDKNLLLKNIKDFYRAKGTENSIRFLMNILYGQENIEFYYPKKDVLRASDGKWFIQRSLRVTDTYVNNVSNSSILAISNFNDKIIRGNTSGATATIERIDRFFEKGTQIDELIISNILGTFVNNEQVFTTFVENGSTKSLTSNVFGGIINTVTVTNAGSGYLVGDNPTVESNSGAGANLRVSKVSTGDIVSITVIDGGAGYQANNFALFSGGGTGTGANAELTLVLNDSSVHPNSYNVVYSTISLERNTPINNTLYSNLNSSNANTTLINSLSFFVYANTGPARIMTVRSSGTNYSILPSVSIIANTSIQELEILGKMVINNGGTGYQIGNIIEFINPPGGYGYGANAIVSNVSGTGVITAVRFVPKTGQIVGGSGYNLLPTANVLSGTGSSANIAVTHRLGEGASFILTNSTLGAVQEIQIINRGSGYTDIPTINLQSLGDGTATANATILEGVFTYPGRYLNDDGFLSSYNFLQDRDYYQTFSYVLRLKESIANYRKAVKHLVHPSGMKLFGQYLVVDEQDSLISSEGGVDASRAVIKTKNYVKTGNVVNVSYSSHGLSTGNTVYLEFITGGNTNVVSGIYTVSANSANNFEVVSRRSSVKTINIVNRGAGYNSNSYIVFSLENGKRANGYYNINASGSIVSVNISDFGMYYSSAPTATANGANTTSATFTVTLNHYANNTSGTANVTILI